MTAKQYVLCKGNIVHGRSTPDGLIAETTTVPHVNNVTGFCPALGPVRYLDATTTERERERERAVTTVAVTRENSATKMQPSTDKAKVINRNGDESPTEEQSGTCPPADDRVRSAAYY